MKQHGSHWTVFDEISSKFVQWESNFFTWMDTQAERHDEANSRFSQF
jgi:hypothetical protein